MGNTISGKLIDYGVYDYRVRLKLNFFKDGKIIETGKPGNYDYTFLNHKDLINKNTQEIKNYILDFIKKKCEMLIMVEYNKKNNPIPLNAIKELSIDLKNKMDSISNDLYGIENSTSEFSIKIDSDGDNKLDKEIIADSDNIKSEKDITLIPIEEN